MPYIFALPFLVLVITKTCKECALNSATFLKCLSDRQKSQQIDKNPLGSKGMVVSQPASMKALPVDSQLCAGGPSNGCRIWESGWRRAGAVNQSPCSPNVFLIRVHKYWLGLQLYLNGEIKKQNNFWHDSLFLFTLVSISSTSLTEGTILCICLLSARYIRE